MTNADLREAYLKGADLRGADLREACLDGAHLDSANLQEANLGGSDFREADLRGANLDGASLNEVRSFYKTKLNPDILSEIKAYWPEKLEHSGITGKKIGALMILCLRGSRNRTGMAMARRKRSRKMTVFHLNLPFSST